MRRGPGRFSRMRSCGAAPRPTGPGAKQRVTSSSTWRTCCRGASTRNAQDSVNAGDLTEVMAQPWQADCLKCHTDWWPTQRPDLAPQSSGTPKDWIRGVSNHKQLIDRSGRLGFIVQQGADEVFLEVE